MSMEIYILSDAQLASIDSWQRAIDEDRSGPRLVTQIPLVEIRGALPVVMHGKSTSFECNMRGADEVMRDLQDVQFGRRWKYAMAIHWSGDIDAGSAAYAAAAAYARATGGVICDCEEGKIISSQRALEISAELTAGRSQIEEAVRRVEAAFQKMSQTPQ